jgi:gluconolactonase
MRIRLIFATLLLWLQVAAFAEPMQAEIVLTGLQFAEGTVFIGQSLYFVDYSASTVYRLDDKRATPVWHQDGCGANGLLSLGDGLLVACYDSGTIQKITLDGRTIQTIERDSKGAVLDRPNDLARGRNGGVYFTASGGDKGTQGKINYLAAEGVPPREVADSIQNANGVAVSPDGKVLYLGESGTDKILKFDISGDGSLKNRREFLALDVALASTPGQRHTPDGIRADKQGRLFVSLYNGGGFAVFDPTGHLLANVSIPGQHHANLALSPDEQYVFGTIAEDTIGNVRSGALYRIANPVAK